MKKLLVVLISLLTVLSLAACSTKEEYDYAAKSEGVMTYDEFLAAEIGSEVTIEAYVQAAQSYWGGAKLYLADPNGAYFVYQDSSLPADMSEEDFAKVMDDVTYGETWAGIANGQKVKVTGMKADYKGEVEIMGSAEIPCTVEVIEEGTKWVAEAKEVTLVEAADAANVNAKALLKEVEVVAANEAGAAFLYNWNGSGASGDDLYFNVSDGTNTINVTVPRYLCYAGSETYKAVEALQVGDKINVEAYLYWYDTVNPHVIAISK